MFRNHVLLSVVGALALVAFVSHSAQAAKPQPPPDPVTGTIYYDLGHSVYSMDAQGLNKTLLPNATVGAASRDTHGGARWFLAAQPVAGTYPNGLTRQELFAVKADGTSVQLTNDPYQMLWAAVWAPAPAVGLDARVAAIGVDYTGYPDVLVGGVYLADVAFAAGYGSDITGLAVGPDLYVDFPLVPVESDPYLWPDPTSVSFAPDGMEFVYGRRSTGELWIWREAGATFLAAEASSPVWSPTGTKIAFGRRDGICTINPDGTDDRRIVRRTTKTFLLSPQWSPTGTHLLYHDSNNLTHEMDICRIGVGGSGKVNLTGDIVGRPFTLGWSG